MPYPYVPTQLPIRVGLIGTGYAARLRAQALQSDPTAKLVAVAGYNPEKTTEFSQTYAATAVHSWVALIERFDLDLVIISTINRDHGAIALAALEANRHVVVEYPLALDLAQAEKIIALARSQNLLLHVEHIELLGGMHRALATALPEVGHPFYARYSTIKPQRPAPSRWTYQLDLFGFPLMGALPRIHRLTNLFGSVTSVSCQTRYWHAPAAQSPGAFVACMCVAKLRFSSGLLAEIAYGKGETLWQSSRKMEVHGDQGALIFEADQGKLIQAETETPIELGSRRGLFAKDTQMVLTHLTTGTPLYVTPEASLYALKVADAARRSAETGQTVSLDG
ncbi:MAG: Gfo/Idh/MocA family oxidoreductase [Cyanothece sp. SIO1E1]|nr:Gfo/Idh/MocA family oxidoreductase [Cyanothece sp. SIO1E1]